MKKWFLYHPAYLTKFNWENVILSENGSFFSVSEISLYTVLIAFPSFYSFTSNNLITHVFLLLRDSGCDAISVLNHVISRERCL